MKKACLFVHKPYQDNAIFEPNSYLNRDNCLEIFRDLKTALGGHGYDLQTQDKHSPKDSALVIYNEIPNAAIEFPDKSAVLLYESELIRPADWTLKSHRQFKFIFTWHDDYVDNIKYFKFNFTHSGQLPFKSFKQRTKLCTLIAGNKSVSHPLELYSERVRAIRWFEQFQPRAFDLYGIGWTTRTFNSIFLNKIFRKFKFLAPLIKISRPSYRGPVQSKLETLSDYKFSICYENARDIPGYITEKIFDSLAAGCVPIYWGAPNISSYVPTDCYIDRTKFRNYEELFRFMTEMSEETYNEYLKAIEAYLISAQHAPFESSFNSKLISERITRADVR